MSKGSKFQDSKIKWAITHDQEKCRVLLALTNP